MKKLLCFILLICNMIAYSQESYLKNGIVTHIKSVNIPDSLINKCYDEQYVIVTSHTGWVINDTIYYVFIDFNYDSIFIENGVDCERFLLNEIVGVYDTNDTNIYIFNAVDGLGTKCILSLVINDKFTILVERNGQLNGYLIDNIKDGYPIKINNNN